MKSIKIEKEPIELVFVFKRLIHLFKGRIKKYVEIVVNKLK
jgi:hypothetical protein